MMGGDWIFSSKAESLIMKHLLIILAIWLTCACSTGNGPRKAIVILVDGVPMDVVERLHVPAVYEVARTGTLGPCHVGGETAMYNETPTISAVGYNCMLTGTWANKHNVFGNHGLSPNYNYWSIFRIVEEQERPLTTAIFSSWTDNRTVLLGEGKEETGGLRLDYAFDGYDLDTVRFPHKEKHLHVFDYDEEVARAAEKCIREDAPDFSWVYLWYTDDAFHIMGNGSYSDEYVLKAGEQIGRIWEAVQYRQKHFHEDWMVIVTTDHGRTLNGYHHGGQTPRERATWIASNKKLNNWVRKGKAAIVDINPTVCEFLGLEVPEALQKERDGVSLLGKAEIEDLCISTYDKEIVLSWTALDPDAQVRVYSATEDLYKTGGVDNWEEVATLKAGAETCRFPHGDARFHKVSVVSSHECLNRWLVE